MVRVCFVCLGNICRSPTAEAVFRKLVKDAGLERQFHIESAGTGDWHVGHPRDARSIAAAERRGIELSGYAQQWRRGDWDRFDHVIAMDQSNYDTLLEGAPVSARDKLRLLRSFDPASPPGASVPDPYYTHGFDEVIDLCLAACAHLLEQAKAGTGIVK
jgi:protein-tyrosine phosphatase